MPFDTFQHQAASLMLGVTTHMRSGEEKRPCLIRPHALVGCRKRRGGHGTVADGVQAGCR